MTEAVLGEVDRILSSSDEADDALRAVVALLASLDGIEGAAIAFLEEGRLAVGPSVGGTGEEQGRHVPIAFQGEPVGELVVSGAVEDELLREVAARIAPYVLIGWDTRGEAWEP